MKLQIIENLDYGMSLLSNGSVLKADGTIITKEQYETEQINRLRNKLDWEEIDINEFTQALKYASFSTQTYAIEESVGGISQSKYGYAYIDEHGDVFYLRASEFSGSEKFEITPVTHSKFIYNINRNSTEQVFEAMVQAFEEVFDTKDQIGSMFSPDSETTYNIKKFIKDNCVWSMVFRDGKLSNIKQGQRLHCEVKAQPKTSKLSNMLNTAKFANMH